jgi:hypothetical protein
MTRTCRAGEHLRLNPSITSCVTLGNFLTSLSGEPSRLLLPARAWGLGDVLTSSAPPFPAGQP